MIFTEEELLALFPDAEQRKIFITGMKRLVKIITERTVNVPFVQLEAQSL